MIIKAMGPSGMGDMAFLLWDNQDGHQLVAHVIMTEATWQALDVLNNVPLDSGVRSHLFCFDWQEGIDWGTTDDGWHLHSIAHQIIDRVGEVRDKGGGCVTDYMVCSFPLAQRMAMSGNPCAMLLSMKRRGEPDKADCNAFRCPQMKEPGEPQIMPIIREYPRPPRV